jgi:hypothetical protein
MQKLIRPFLALLFLTFSMTLANAQNNDCNCSKDLELLNKKIKKTPSYKINKTVYKNQFLKTEKEVENLNSGYECFVQLNKLMLSLHDNHSRVYGSKEGANEEIINDTVRFNEFKKSKLFNMYPRPNMNLDSLKIVLKNQPIKSIEGIYSRTDYMTLGVYKQVNKATYRAIVLKSENKLWEVGEVLYTLIPFGNDYLLAVGGSMGSKRMVAHTERIESGVFLTTRFQKNPSKPNFSVSLYPESNYLRKEISPEITYLKVGSFSSWNPKLSEAEKFYKSLEGTLTKKNLIVDLRDNGGGGNRNSNGLFDILKDYLESNNVYVLINNRTTSNAEQFVYKLSAFDNCTTFGNRTNGTVAYERVDDNYNLPCGNFLAILTSKKHSKFLKLESIGLEPDILLKTETDWMLELQNYIQKK